MKTGRLNIHQTKRGMRVYWHDPDGDACSKWDYVQDIADCDGQVAADTIVVLKSGTEVYANELSLTGPIKKARKK